MQVNTILETSLYGRDLKAMEKFYSDVLGLKPFVREEGRHVFFRCGQRILLIFNPDQSQIDMGEVPPHGAEGSGHVAFAVPEKHLHRWKAYMQDKGIDIEREVTWPSGAGSFYFRDPANNSIEIASTRIWNIDENTLAQEL